MELPCRIECFNLGGKCFTTPFHLLRFYYLLSLENACVLNLFWERLILILKAVLVLSEDCLWSVLKSVCKSCYEKVRLAGELEMDCELGMTKIWSCSHCGFKNWNMQMTVLEPAPPFGGQVGFEFVSSRDSGACSLW